MPAPFLVAASLLLAASSFAQTTNSAPAPATPPAQEEIIELSPFVVSADSDVGYVANDTLAGSRLRTKLSDVANAISVFTPEFMNDLAATNELDLMRYSASAAPELTDQTPAVQGISNFEGLFRSRIRGQLATRARNYFDTNLLPDTYNSERVEEARGPNAILFGIGGAGGLLNTSTKQARLNKTSTDLMLTVGSWNQYRVTLDHNQKLAKNAAIRVNAVTEEANGWHPYDVKENNRIHVAGTYKPWKKLTLRGEYEEGHMTDSVTRSFTPADFVSVWALNGRTTLASATGAPTAAQIAAGIGRRNTEGHVTFIGNDGTFVNFQNTIFTNHTVATGRNRSAMLPDDWAKIATSEFPYESSFFGPGGYVDNKQSTYSFFAESEPIKNLFVELAFNHDQREHNIYDANINVMEIRGEPAQTYRDGRPNPYVGQYYIETFPIRRNSFVKSDRYRATLAYTLDLGKWGRHNLAGLASRDESDNPRHTDFLVLTDGPLFNANPSNIQNRIWLRQYITNPADASQWAVPDWRSIPENISVVRDAGAAPTSYRSGWAIDSANNPVATIDSTMASLQSYFWDDRIVTTGGVRRVEYEQTRGTGLDRGGLDFKSYGVVVKPIKKVSLYYNFSENGFPPTSVQTLIPNESLFPVNTGKGKDYGVMLSLLDEKLFVRFGYFESSSVDQAKAASVGPNLSTPHERIVNALVGASLAPVGTPLLRGGDFDLADVATDGYELNLTANPTDSWRIILNASKSSSVDSNLLKVSKTIIEDNLPLWNTAGGSALVTSSGLTIANEVANILAWRDSFLALEGDSTIGHRELQVRLFTRYDFKQGALKGLFVGGGYLYSGPSVIGKLASTGAYIESPGFDDADFLLGYKTKLPALFGPRVNVTLQFNAQNLLQQRQLTLVRADTDGQIFRGVATPPRRYQVSARFAF